ncbi:serine hydrolase domain-containing protein [Piscibacillus salipiscarius]|nr:serine hydrolase [Piscibacillus salipiscarius]
MFKKISVWFLFTLLLVNLWSAPLAHAADSITTTDVDEYVKQYLDQNGLPGAAVVIVKDGELIYEKGYGHDSEGNQLTANTKIGLASGTKPFTAFAVLQLVDEGKVELDEPITSYLSNLTISDNRWDQVTVRHLLSHTSGLPNPTIVGPAFTLKEGVERLQNWELKTDPGENYFYSNANYWVLAYLVEQVSGVSFNDYLTENIFSPLEMRDSISLVNSGDIYHETSIPQGYVTLYGTAMPWTELEKMFSGSGSIFTTAHDMGKWLAMHTNSGKAAGGDPLLSQSLLEESYASQTK